MFILRLVKLVIRILGGYAVLAVTCLIFVVAGTALGFSSAVNGVAFGPLFRLGITAILLSWFMARTRLPTWIAGIFLVLLGGIISFVTIGDLWVPLFSWLRTAIGLAWEYLQGMRGDQLDLIPIQLASSDVGLRFTEAWSIFVEWGSSTLRGNLAYATQAVATTWGFVIWLIAAWAGWVQRRYSHPMISILPAGILLTIGLAYTRSVPTPIFTILIGFIPLIALSSFHTNEHRWRSTGMDFPGDTPLELAAATVIISAVLLGAAIFVPRISIRAISNYIQDLRNPAEREQTARVFESLGIESNASGDGNIQSAISVGMPRKHLLGSGPELSTELVMEVRLTGGMSVYAIQELNIPLYWRSLTYDIFTGIGWQSSQVASSFYRSGKAALRGELPNHWMLQQDVVHFGREGGLVYSAGDLIAVDKDYSIGWRSTPRETTFANTTPDYLGASTEAINYRLQSWLPIAGEADLRSATEDYPTWISERYLELPSSITPRVYQLAEEITVAETNTYDKARAIEAYLRTFEYNLDVELPPAERDFVDYFLFDMQEGYCDYFATAMVVMARSVGIPSRLAVGYAHGAFDQANQRFIVSEAEAHSWVEVYFPMGWIPFEPTPGSAEIERPIRSGDTAEQTGQKPDELVPWTARLLGTWQNTLIRVPLAVIVLVILWFAVDGWWLRQFPSDQTIERIYRRLYRHGRRLRVPAKRGGTPYEFAANLEAHLASLGDGSRFDGILFLGIREIRILATTYGSMLYSPRPVTITDKLLAFDTWMQLRRRLFLARWVQLGRRLTRKKFKVDESSDISPSESTE